MWHTVMVPNDNKRERDWDELEKLRPESARELATQKWLKNTQAEWARATNWCQDNIDSSRYDVGDVPGAYSFAVQEDATKFKMMFG